MKGCNVCLTLKVVQHKPYDDLQFLPIPTPRCKNLSIVFATGLPILTNWKEDSYNSIFFIIDRLMKIVYYKSIKISINALGLPKVIINVVVNHYDLPNSIVTNQGLFFTSKFWLLLSYFLDIKQKLSIAFYLQIDKKTEG